jgi:hypothetical protein
MSGHIQITLPVRRFVTDENRVLGLQNVLTLEMTETGVEITTQFYADGQPEGRARYVEIPTGPRGLAIARALVAMMEVVS